MLICKFLAVPTNSVACVCHVYILLTWIIMTAGCISNAYLNSINAIFNCMTYYAMYKIDLCVFLVNHETKIYVFFVGVGVSGLIEPPYNALCPQL